MKVNKIHVRGAFNQKGVMTNSMVQLTFDLKDSKNKTKRYSHEFFEIESLYVPLILGTDFLGKNRIPVICGKINPAVTNKKINDKNVLRVNNEHVTTKVTNDQPKSKTKQTTEVETTEEFKQNLEKLKNKYREMLDRSLGRVNHYTHEIKMNTMELFKSKTYPIPRKYFDEVLAQVQDMEKMGVIKRTATQYLSPLIAVKKPNRKIRVS